MSAAALAHPAIPTKDAHGLLMKDINGKPVSVGDYTGRLVVLNLWGHGVPPAVGKCHLFPVLQARLIQHELPWPRWHLKMAMQHGSGCFMSLQTSPTFRFYWGAGRTLKQFGAVLDNH